MKVVIYIREFIIIYFLKKILLNDCNFLFLYFGLILKLFIIFVFKFMHIYSFLINKKIKSLFLDNPSSTTIICCDELGLWKSSSK